MGELDLYQFLKENKVEMRWDGDVLSAWISHWNLSDFTQLIASSLNDGGIDARLQSYGAVWVDLAPICQRYGIEPERILPIPVSA
jgi:hypothetical protein